MKLSEQAWGSCRGSTPGSRGYPCALWQLFHVLAANAPDDGGVLWLTAVKGFMGNFFPCQDCSQHFVGLASEDEAARVRTADEALLWSWRAHNKVNERVAKDEMEGGFEDPLHPKVQWPPPALCPACRLGGGATDGGGGVGSGSDWDEGETLKFLKRYYGAGPGEGDAAGGAGRWHMQGHRKASFDRSQRYEGRLQSGHGRLVRTVFWAVVLLAAVLAFMHFCTGLPARSISPRPQQRFGNGRPRRP